MSTSVQTVKKDNIKINLEQKEIYISGYVTWLVTIGLIIVTVLYLEKKFSVVRKNLKRIIRKKR